MRCGIYGISHDCNQEEIIIKKSYTKTGAIVPVFLCPAENKHEPKILNNLSIPSLNYFKIRYFVHV